MSVNQLFETLIARKWLFITILSSIVLAVLMLSLVWPKTYIAEASVVVDSKSTDPVSGVAQAPDLLPSTIATQVDVISSHNVARKVAEKLRLKLDPEYREKYEKATSGAGSIDDWIAGYLLKRVSVNPSHDSHVINIDVAAADPASAAKLANTFADAYIQTSLELKVDPAKRQGEWFSIQLKSLRATLEQAQARLSSAQQASGVMGTNDQIDIENTRLAELSQQLIATQATMYEKQNTLKQMNRTIQLNKLDEMPELSNNLLIQGLRTDLVRAQAKLAETAERFGVHHPQYISADAEVKALESKLQRELNTAAGSISQAAEISTRQQAEIQKALNQQRDRVLQLKRDKDRIDILRRDVDSAQSAYDAGLQRANQMHLESQLDQSNIAILNAAIEPVFAAKPKVLLNVLIAFVIGSIIAFASAIAAEGIDPRVRSGTLFTALTGVALLAEIPRGKRRRGRGRVGGGNAQKLPLLKREEAL